ncbi:MAG: nucleoside deaminase [Verrucomicrobiales bacterium]|nr:nucleoside deaminase [Verrucomicrobiales bacterium]
MALIGELALENVRRDGGPFAAGVWDLEQNRWVSAGVNLVLSSNLSSAHAEIVAISLAQTSLGSWDLGDNSRRLELVSSAEPCAMCTGAVPWSGVVSLVFGAARTDAEAAGFDEGAKPQRWKSELAQRGVQVAGPVQAVAARQALKDFASRNPPYNGRPRPATG